MFSKQYCDIFVGKKKILYPFNTFCKYFCDLLRDVNITIKPFAKYGVATFTFKFGHLNETLVLASIDGFLNKPRYVMTKKTYLDWNG
jgi:hypothetical protein